LVELEPRPDGRRRFRVMEGEEQHEENENWAPPTPLNPERSPCSPEVVRTSSPLRRRELSGLKTTPISRISTRWILVFQLIRFRESSSASVGKYFFPDDAAPQIPPDHPINELPPDHPLF
jgi:hypothetical protein